MRSLTPDHTDLKKAVMTSDDDKWFIIPTEHVDDMVKTTCVSVIVHKCDNWTADLLSPNGLPYESLGYWTTPGSVATACLLCDVPPPEAIASLWTLHNFDTFAGAPDEISRMLARDILKSWSWGLHSFAVTNVEGPCPCRECRERYGASV